MSKRRKPGDWVYLKPNSGFTGKSHLLRAEIQNQGSSECLVCQDDDCIEWDVLWTEPDTKGKRQMLCHVSECQMLDEPFQQETK